MPLKRRLAVTCLGLLGWDAVRLPGPVRDVLIMPRRTRDRVDDMLLEQHLARLLERFAVNCVLDVGANQGQYGLELRRAGYGGHIVSFEPVPECFRILAQVAAVDARWRAYPWALGKEEGTGWINVTAQSAMSSFLTPNAYAGQCFGSQVDIVASHEVPVRRLDRVIESAIDGIAEPRLFLKLDTQGLDLEVFEGLGGWAAKLVGLQSEVSAIPIYKGMARLWDNIAQYEAHGFEITGMFPVSRDQKTSRVIEFDCVMVRASLAPGDH